MTKKELLELIPDWVFKAAYHVSALPGVGDTIRAALSDRNIDTIPQLKAELERGGPYPPIPRFAGLTKLKAYNAILFLHGQEPVDEIPVPDVELALVMEWRALLKGLEKKSAARKAAKRLITLGIDRKPKEAFSRIHAGLVALGHTGNVTYVEIVDVCVGICLAKGITTINPPPPDETVQWWKDRLVESLNPSSKDERARLDAAVSAAAGLLKGELQIEGAIEHLLANIKDIAEELTVEQLATVCVLSVKEARYEREGAA